MIIVNFIHTLLFCLNFLLEYKICKLLINKIKFIQVLIIGVLQWFIVMIILDILLSWK